MRDGWFFKGQLSEHLSGPRGSDPAGLAPDRFVICIQNHDQVGNRALGERLHQQIERAAYRAATALLLLAPETPLLFMGQEWAAPEPFLYFTDHTPELGCLVTDGRRREFQHFAAFSDPAARERIPDPQARSTFEHSRLDWGRRAEEPHASVLRLYRALVRLRRDEPLLRHAPGRLVTVTTLGEDALALRYGSRLDADAAARGLLVVVRLKGQGPVSWPADARARPEWRVTLSTEEPAYAADPRPVGLETSPAALVLRFARPGAVVLTDNDSRALMATQKGE